jgi:hypothetical protein
MRSISLILKQLSGPVLLMATGLAIWGFSAHVQVEPPKAKVYLKRNVPLAVSLISE